MDKGQEEVSQVFNCQLFIVNCQLSRDKVWRHF